MFTRRRKRFYWKLSFLALADSSVSGLVTHTLGDWLERWGDLTWPTRRQNNFCKSLKKLPSPSRAPDRIPPWGKLRRLRPKKRRQRKYFCDWKWSPMISVALLHVWKLDSCCNDVFDNNCEERELATFQVVQNILCPLSWELFDGIVWFYGLQKINSRFIAINLKIVAGKW